MNDLSLDQRLRALRAPPPENGFEVRLGQALWREAHVQRVNRGAAPLSSARSVRRWGRRVSLGVALALGATAAAAAAGGIWVVVTRSAERPLPPPAAARAGEHVAPPRASSAHVPAPFEVAPPEPTQEQLEEPRAPVPVPAEMPRPAAGVGKVPDARAARPAASSSRATPARSSPSASEASVPLAPFELPKRPPLPPTAAALNGSRPAAAAADRSGSATASERRVLPEVASRSERSRARPEHPEKRDRSAGPPGRALGLERQGRDKAERGLERAREVRGGK